MLNVQYKVSVVLSFVIALPSDGMNDDYSMSFIGQITLSIQCLANAVSSPEGS